MDVYFWSNIILLFCIVVKLKDSKLVTAVFFYERNFKERIFSNPIIYD